MNKFKEAVEQLAKQAVSELSHPSPGIITKYDIVTNTATINIVDQHTNSIKTLTLPWPIQSEYISLPAPRVGGSVIVDFRGGDSSFPYISKYYEPDNKQIREKLKENQWPLKTIYERLI